MSFAFIAVWRWWLERRHWHAHPSINVCHMHHHIFQHIAQSQPICLWCGNDFLPEGQINWALLYKQQSEQALTNNKKENQTQQDHSYKVGDFVFIAKNPMNAKERGNILLLWKEPTKLLNCMRTETPKSNVALLMRTSPFPSSAPLSKEINPNSAWNFNVPFLE